MVEKTDNLRGRGGEAAAIDAFDRKILAALTDDARRPYAEIGAQVGLSAPAVHERVKRLRASGVLKRMTTQMNPAAIGKPFLAYIHITADGWGKSESMMALANYPEVEELHSVAGDACMIMKLRTENAQAMERFLSQLYALPGIRGTKSYVVLSTYVERPMQAEMTTDWPEITILPE